MAECFHRTHWDRKTCDRLVMRTVVTPSGCWEWTGYRDSKGYGRTSDVRHGLGQCGAHRIAWVHYFGAIPDGMLVCHRCDNPPCVNPDHLFIGTYEDNAQDMARKGRGRRGVGPRKRRRYMMATALSGT